MRGDSFALGFTEILGLIFITLKLIGVDPVASWSWLWVLAPLWIPLGFCLIILGLFGIAMMYVSLRYRLRRLPK